VSNRSETTFEGGKEEKKDVVILTAGHPIRSSIISNPSFISIVAEIENWAPNPSLLAYARIAIENEACSKITQKISKTGFTSQISTRFKVLETANWTCL